jgi:flagellar biosynthesis/type III secretory pathway chaperone
MRATENDFDGLVNELVDVLDENICQVKLTLLRLDELRKAVIKRDEAGLRALLETIKDEGPEYRRVELRRENIRARLANFLGYVSSELNLSRLCTNVSEDKRKLILNRQKELGGLVERLRNEHISTRILLAECRRFNNVLLRGIFGQSEGSVTYDRRGGTSRDSGRGTMSMKL